MKKVKIIFSTLVISLLLLALKNQNANNDYVRYVDPFIGSGGHGHVFVGANVPFGGVQVGPTNFNKGWDLQVKLGEGYTCDQDTSTTNNSMYLSEKNDMSFNQHIGLMSSRTVLT